MKKSLFRKLEILSMFAGLALFAYLIRQTGLGTLAHYLGMLGWGAGLILALSAVRNLARSGAWYLSIEPEHRSVSFLSLTNVMLAGEAIKYLTATGPFLGEPAKAAMVRRDVPLLQGLSSVVVESLIYQLSVFLFIMAGLPALGWVVPVPGKLQAAAYAAAGAAIAGVLFAWLAMRRRWYFLSGLLRRLSRHPLFAGRARFGSAHERTRSLEENVYSFYERRRGAFYAILLLGLTAHMINIVEVCLILWLMGLPYGLVSGFVIEAVTKLINMAFFFIPTRAGVYESGNAMVFGALGMAASAGVALAIIRKLRAFVWVGYGLGVISALAFADRRAAARGQAGDSRAAEGAGAG